MRILRKLLSYTLIFLKYLSFTLSGIFVILLFYSIFWNVFISIDEEQVRKDFYNNYDTKIEISSIHSSEDDDEHVYMDIKYLSQGKKRKQLFYIV